MAKYKKRKLNSHHPQIKPTAQTPKKPPSHAQTTSPTLPFSPSDRILLVGEGDFSFARSLVEHHGCYDITATCLDTKPELYEKYHPQAEQNIDYLTTSEQTVLYSIDATKLDSVKTLRKGGGAPFDRIIFNFPHIGGKTKDVNRQVRFNQSLLVNFFTSATSSPLLSPNGTIIITLFEGTPYTLWNIRDLARHSGLEVERSFKFVPGVYPGYKHARTLGNVEGGGGWRGEEREARSFVFRRKGEQGVSIDSKRKRRRKDEDETSGDEDEGE